MKRMNLNEEVEKTLSSLDSIESVNVSEEFEKKLNQKIAFLPKSESSRWLRYSIAAMITLAIVNGIVLIDSFSSGEVEQEISHNILFEVIDTTEFE